MLKDWTVKIKRYKIKGRFFWYKTEDAGFTWSKISTKQAMEIVDNLHGVVIKQSTIRRSL